MRVSDQLKLREFGSWLRRHAKSLLVFSVGLAVGIGCRYPTGWALPDNTAAMFAALIGAFATASAVVLGVDLQRATDEAKVQLRQANTRAHVRVMFMELFSQAGIAYEAFDDAERRARVSENLLTDCQKVIEHLRAATGVREDLDYEGSLLLKYIELEIDSFLLTAKLTVAFAEQIKLKPGSAVELIAEAKQRLAKATNDLIDKVNEFSPHSVLSSWKLPAPP